MKIKDFFEKDINRNIETVIKADDREHISDEVSEYVITKEIGQKISNFFQAYTNYAGANGVWISGFFGSGKSHLLKILSYVLENKQFGNNQSGQVFAEKIQDDAILKGDVLSAIRIPSESILFNIDQQSKITSKTDPAAILSVFYKVFYDHLGFYGSQLHVAKFEQWLATEGKYDAFLAKYETIRPAAWKEERRKYFAPKTKDAVGQALGELYKDDPAKYRNIIDELRKDLAISIEDFSERVNDYIKTKPAGFRLNFFVDEVGQYISDNTKLMTNLQTMAESLATKAKGQAWIFVTSQEAMDKVVGDMSQSQENDFSKIQARFKIKVPLTSANVDEVIEKRLLEKKAAPQKLLVTAFKKDKAHLDTLLSFSDGGVQFKFYQDAADFGNKFPFVPYQFDLFQQCRKALSAHNAFQGKHASTGERSMLGVFQQVIQSIEEKDQQALVSFDKLFEGIRNELKGEIQSSIILAENNLGYDNPFAIKVLKALFLVKYFANFKPTRRNISVLMIDDIKVDIKAHEKAIDVALNTLENQSYVQRNGEVFEFLTDDEKDVEQEIKNTDIDDAAITTLLKEVFFDGILQENRIKFIENNHSYDFSNKIDGTLVSREKELTIELITDDFYNYQNTAALQAETMGNDTMRVVLPIDAIFSKDLRMYLKTAKYVKNAQSTSNRVAVKRILHEKGLQNTERRRNLLLLGNKLLSTSTIYMNGTKHDVGQSSDGKTRIIKAFQDLIKSVYSNLRMLKGGKFSEETIKTVIRTPADALFHSDDATMTEAESEILNRINRRKKQSDRTSLLDLKTIFTRKPFGWHPNAIWTIVAKLHRRGKVEIKQDSNLLDDEEVLNALLNSANYGNTLLEAQTEYAQRDVKRLSDVYSDAFDETCSLKEAKDVATDFKAKIEQMYVKVSQLLTRKNQYPFLKSLDPFYEKLGQWNRKDYKYFLENLDAFEDDLVDNKENLLDPIKRFMAGDQIKIYDSIRDLLNGDTSNLKYVEGTEFATLQSLIQHGEPYKGNLIKEAKAAKDTLKKKVFAKIDAAKAAAKLANENAIKDLESKAEFQQLDNAQQQTVLEPLKSQTKKIEAERFIAVLKDTKSSVGSTLLPQQLNEMVRLANPVSEDPSVASEPKVHYIPKSIIDIDFDKTALETVNDVEAYLDALRKAYLAEIANNKRITL